MCLKQAAIGLQVARAEAEVREQATRLSEMKALQTEVEALRERLRAAQQQCSGLEATASLVPGLKSQVSVLNKQVHNPSVRTDSHKVALCIVMYAHAMRRLMLCAGAG